MSDVDEKVMSAVEAALKENPEATVDELFALAKTVNEGVAQLTRRQFHARYPLQVKRRLAPRTPRRPRRSKAAPPARQRRTQGSVRESVRACLLRFASDLAAAEGPKELVGVVAGVDRYVDEVLKATGKR